MAMLQGERRQEEAGRLFNAVRTAVFLVSSLMLVVAFLVISVLCGSELFWQTERFDTGETLIVFLLCGYAFVRVQAGPIQGIFFSSGKYALGVYIGALSLLLEFAGVVIALALGAGPLGVAASYVVTASVGLLIQWVVAVRMASWPAGGVWPVWATVRPLARPAVASLMFPLGNAMNHQGIRILLGILAGPASLTTFVASRMMVGLSVRVLDGLGQVLEPEYARAHGANDDAAMRQLVLHSSHLGLWFSLTVVVLLWLTGEALFVKWTNGKCEFHSAVFALLLCGAVLNATWFNVMKILYATNRHGTIAFVYLLAYVGACLLAIPLQMAFGLPGAAAALVVAEAGIAIYVLPVSLRAAGLTAGEWLRTVMVPPVYLVGKLVQAFFGRLPASKDVPR